MGGADPQCEHRLRLARHGQDGRAPEAGAALGKLPLHPRPGQTPRGRSSKLALIEQPRLHGAEALGSHSPPDEAGDGSLAIA
jgi:hypothetical protein